MFLFAANFIHVKIRFLPGTEKQMRLLKRFLEEKKKKKVFISEMLTSDPRKRCRPMAFIKSPSQLPAALLGFEGSPHPVCSPHKKS